MASVDGRKHITFQDDSRMPALGDESIILRWPIPDLRAYDLSRCKPCGNLRAGRAKGDKSMNEVSRRSLLGGAVAAAATTLWNEPVRAQYVWQKSDWQSNDFDALTRSSKRIKQVIHGFGMNDGRVLKNAKNSLNRLPLRAVGSARQIQ